jgi:hypothetical protein
MNAVRAPGGEASFRAYSQRDVTVTTEIVDLLLTTVDTNSARLHYIACLHGSSSIARRLSVDKEVAPFGDPLRRRCYAMSAPRPPVHHTRAGQSRQGRPSSWPITMNTVHATTGMGPRRATSPSASRCTKNIAEQFPRVALKPREPVLLDGRKVGGGSIDKNARLQHRRRKRLEVRCLLHDVFATEVIATPSKNLLLGLRHRVAQGS